MVTVSAIIMIGLLANNTYYELSETDLDNNKDLVSQNSQLAKVIFTISSLKFLLILLRALCISLILCSTLLSIVLISTALYTW